MTATAVARHHCGIPQAPDPATLGRFCWVLRGAGLGVCPDETLAYCRAVSGLGPLDTVELYWIGRTCLVKDPSGAALYDEIFRSFFGGRGRSGTPAGSSA